MTLAAHLFNMYKKKLLSLVSGKINYLAMAGSQVYAYIPKYQLHEIQKIYVRAYLKNTET